MIYGKESIFWQAWKARLLVFACLVAGQCLSILPLWQGIGIYPPLYLVLIHYWIIYRPHLLPVEQLILLSLVQDGMYAYPLGFSALRLLVDYTLLTIWKKFSGTQGFAVSWGGFGIFMMGDACIYLMLLSCIKQQWVSPFILIPGVVLTTVAYPVAVWAINKIMNGKLF